MRYLTLILVLLMGSFALGQDEKEVPENVAKNQECFKCHGSPFYTYYNDWIERDVKDRMNPYFVIDSAKFYNSNHKDFVCIDCHSMDYENFPHDGSLRMEPKYTCLDCHGGDDHYAKYHFEKIQEEFEQSVHSSRHDETFTCWMCHDPHTYKINARTNLDIKEIITYDNEICLSCHADIDKYQLITNARNPNILETHSWLPNQALHFQNVRCIECHAKTNDTLLVAHLIQPKEKAVKKCVECHSKNSILMASLYKHMAQNERDAAGFFNAAILNQSYVIGANRNIYLNWISIVLFGFVFVAIFVHTVLRIIKK